MDQTAHEGAGSEYHGVARKTDPRLGVNPEHSPLLDVEAGDFRLLEVEVRLMLQDLLHPEPVQLLVRLGAGGAHRRTFPGVEDAELDAGCVDVLSHLAAEGVDLLHQVTLGQAADGRVAGHQGNGVQVDGEKERRAPHARRGERRLAAGMPGPHHDHVVFFIVEDQLLAPSLLRCIQPCRDTPCGYPCFGHPQGVPLRIVALPITLLIIRERDNVSQTLFMDTVSQPQPLAARASTANVPRGTSFTFRHRIERRSGRAPRRGWSPRSPRRRHEAPPAVPRREAPNRLRK